MVGTEQGRVTSQEPEVDCILRKQLPPVLYILGRLIMVRTENGPLNFAEF